MKARETKAGKVTGYQGQRKTILIVDDRWENCSVLFNLLEPLGFEIIEAANGRQGLTQAQLARPDLVLTDLMMSELDGFGLITAITADDTLKSIPIVGSSANVFDADQHKCLDAGAVDFLPKPVQIDELLAVLQRHLNLEWVYETIATQLDLEQDDRVVDFNDKNYSKSVLEEMKIPDGAYLEQLTELSLAGDLDGLTEAVRLLDGCYSAFAASVTTMAANFEINQLKTFMQQAQSVAARPDAV